ncbi:MAG: SDR family oxidoreductase [Deltaproteobacteria bacterium]|nr:SDR family oxidoreductase [Deltaproteobacteria bacterium]
MTVETNISARNIAVVSGGAGGIGRAVVLRLRKDGFFPVILDVDEAAGHEFTATLKQQGSDSVFFTLNAAKKPEVQKVFGKVISDYGRVDVLVNLAGGTFYKKPIQDFSPAEWQEVIDNNLKATFLCCQAVIAPMKTQKKGAIINTSSNYGVTGSAERTAYSAAKAAIIGFSKSLSAELAPFGIRVNAIAPGRTATQRVISHHSPEAWAVAGQDIPMGRVAEPEEIAEGIAFLAGDDAGYITGQTLHVNGGMVMP